MTDHERIKLLGHAVAVALVALERVLDKGGAEFEKEANAVEKAANAVLAEFPDVVPIIAET